MDPFRELQQVSDRLSRVFAGCELASSGEQALKNFVWARAVHISETDKAYLIKADLPEVKREDVDIILAELPWLV